MMVSHLHNAVYIKNERRLTEVHSDVFAWLLDANARVNAICLDILESIAWNAS